MLRAKCLHVGDVTQLLPKWRILEPPRTTEHVPAYFLVEDIVRDLALVLAVEDGRQSLHTGVAVALHEPLDLRDRIKI